MANKSPAYFRTQVMCASLITGEAPVKHYSAFGLSSCPHKSIHHAAFYRNPTACGSLCKYCACLLFLITGLFCISLRLLYRDPSAAVKRQQARTNKFMNYMHKWFILLPRQQQITQKVWMTPKWLFSKCSIVNMTAENVKKLRHRIQI